MDELNGLSARDAAQAIAAGEISSEQLTRACLDRVRLREADVRAWAHIDADAALAEARARDGEAPRGPLHGVPVGFKDIIATADMPTACGSPIYQGHRPAADAAAVALVRAAGGIVLGKTVTTEFAFIEPGKTRNPHNPAHTPGGSSSGSAAAVADRMVPLAFGTQTGGSVIRPASFCGVVGYKPSFGQFSYAGTKLFAGSLDTLGVMARSVGDLALIRHALLGAPDTVVAPDRPPRLGLCRTPWWDQAEPAARTALEAAAAACAAAGAEIREVALPDDFADLPETNRTIMIFEGRRSLAHEFNRHADQLSDRLREALTPDPAIEYTAYQAAVTSAARCRGQFAEVLAGLDALVVPSAVGEAPKGFDTTGDALFSRAWTTIGAPCVTLPGAVGPQGLPVGVQLVAGAGADEHLLAVAGWAEAVFA